jgi:flagellar basal body rod protein FlgG
LWDGPSPEAISDNLANATQPGYKKLTADHKVIDLIFRDALAGPITGRRACNTNQSRWNFTPGPLRNTDRRTIMDSRDAFSCWPKDGRD